MSVSSSTRPQETGPSNTSPRMFLASTGTDTSRNIGNIPKHLVKDHYSKLTRSDAVCSPNPPHKRKRQEYQLVEEKSEPRSPNRKRQVLDSYADTPPDGSISHRFSVPVHDNDENDKISSPISPALSQATIPDSEEYRREIDDQFSAESVEKPNLDQTLPVLNSGQIPGSQTVP